MQLTHATPLPHASSCVPETQPTEAQHPEPHALAISGSHTVVQLPEMHVGVSPVHAVQAMPLMPHARSEEATHCPSLQQPGHVPGRHMHEPFSQTDPRPHGGEHSPPSLPPGFPAQRGASTITANKQKANQAMPDLDELTGREFTSEAVQRRAGGGGGVSMSSSSSRAGAGARCCGALRRCGERRPTITPIPSRKPKLYGRPSL